jgi:hypothetical protein
MGAVLLALEGACPAHSALAVPVPADSASANRGRVSVDEQKEMKKTLTDIGRDEVQGGQREWERKKVPRVAMLSSAVLPGLGQVYNGRRLKVGVLAGFMTFYTGNIIINWQKHKFHEAQRDLLPQGTSAWKQQDALSLFHEERATDFMWWAGATWLIGILDAWIDAHLYDVRAYSPESPDPGQAPTGASIGLRTDGMGSRYLMLSIGF